MDATPASPGYLTGIRVLDLTHAHAGGARSEQKAPLQVTAGEVIGAAA